MFDPDLRGSARFDECNFKMGHEPAIHERSRMCDNIFLFMTVVF